SRSPIVPRWSRRSSAASPTRSSWSSGIRPIRRGRPWAKWSHSRSTGPPTPTSRPGSSDATNDASASGPSCARGTSSGRRQSDMIERFRLFVASAPGLEALLATELETLGVEEAAVVAGGVSCFGDRETIYRLNLGCGLGLRVLVHIAEFIVRDFRKLERVAAALDWERWLDPDRGVRVRAHSKRSRLYHTKGIAERIERGIELRTRGKIRLRADEARGPGGGELGEGSREPTLIQVRLVRDRCTISVDTTGMLLHKRGWRQETGKAPLREDIARALIVLTGWRPGVGLLDPMCGSGTLPIEAATIAAGLPPGHARRFSCMDSPEFDAALFEQAKASLVRPARDAATLVGCERDRGALEVAR